MSAAADLQDTAMLLTRGMAQDATLSLALAAAWLDPLWLVDMAPYYDQAEYEGDETALTLCSLDVARGCSPRTYVEALQGLRSGWSHGVFERAFWAALRRDYPSLPSSPMADILYGIPLQFYGLSQTGSAFTSEHPELAAVLDRYFDLRPSPRGQPYSAIPERDFEAARSMAYPIIRSLIAQDCQPYADLALLLLYLFSLTGNTLLDYADPDYWEAGDGALWWEPDNLEMVEEAYRQAQVMLAAGKCAIAALDRRPDISEALLNNIAAARAAQERSDPHVCLAWPRPARPRRAKQDAQRGTGPGVGLLLVRRCYAQED